MEEGGEKKKQNAKCKTKETKNKIKDSKGNKKTAGDQIGPGGVSGCADSNRGPPRPKRGALPAALHPGEV
jgi:hypothetical protein